MPYKSEAQRKFMHAKHPEIAKRWDEHTADGTLPERVGARRDPSKPDPALARALKSIEN